MEDLLTLSYRSIAKLRDPIQDVADILHECQKRNSQLGVTGILMFGGQYFMQTIEGPTDKVGMLFLNILDDPRHVNVIPFGVTNIKERSFPDWGMKLIGPNATARIMPDMDEFDFTGEHLDKIHTSVKSTVRKPDALQARRASRYN